MLRRQRFWKGGVGFWSRNRKFWKGWSWSRIFYLRHRKPDIYMYQLILLIFVTVTSRGVAIALGSFADWRNQACVATQ